MNPRRAVLDILEDLPNGLCDACLLQTLDAKSHQSVNATCRSLEHEGRLVREKLHYIECDGCRKIRVINKLVRAVAVRQLNSQTPQKSTFGIDDLDALRRDLIQYLNRLDPNTSREGFGKRVTQLRNNQRLSSTIASLMLTHAAYRNELYYNQTSLAEGECRILEEIEAHLRTHIANS